MGYKVLDIKNLSENDLDKTFYIDKSDLKASLFKNEDNKNSKKILNAYKNQKYQ